MAKRIYFQENGEGHSMEELIAKWESYQIETWALRAKELFAELTEVDEAYEAWAKEYRLKNEHREDFEADDEWNMRWMEWQAERYTLEDEVDYVKVCLEDKIKDVIF